MATTAQPLPKRVALLVHFVLKVPCFSPFNARLVLSSLHLIRTSALLVWIPSVLIWEQLVRRPVLKDTLVTIHPPQVSIKWGYAQKDLIVLWELPL